MTDGRQTEGEIREATVRRLQEQGYDVIVEPSPSILPNGLRHIRPDAVALGKEPKLIVEIASEGPRSAERVAAMQAALKLLPDWKLHLVLNRASAPPIFQTIADAEIVKVLDRARDVAKVDSRAGLLMAWAAFEALSRHRGPGEFARPQSPGRLIERLASRGVISPSESVFLRSMAQTRNLFVHGGLMAEVTLAEIDRFVSILTDLIGSESFRTEFAAP